MVKSTLGRSDRDRRLGAVDEYRRGLYSVTPAWVGDGEPPVVFGTAPWGRAKIVRGGITQRHLDLLDCIRATAEHRLSDSSGQTHLIFDDAEVRKKLGKGRGRWRDVREMLRDFMTTIVQIEGRTPGAWGIEFSLATKIGDTDLAAPRRADTFPACLRRLVLSAEYTAFLTALPSVSYSPTVLDRVLALHHLVSRAIARWCLSHTNDQHHPLDVVLAALGVVDEGEAIAGRAARSSVRRLVGHVHEDAAGLAELGITITSAFLHYKRLPGVFIRVPGASPGAESGARACRTRRQSVPNPAPGL
ncbi:hypothetical protein [Diaphorobacter sp.]|uniref:hypothetical protein n=1 Tax=Diaphorobacter sp. TaxID=1934310 RepID=UPI0025874A5E|nr:hypothetical protein [Diaphorobacter sp.]